MQPKQVFAILGLLAFGGCEVVVEMDTTPETVGLGDMIHYEVKLTNVAVCPTRPGSLSVLPLLSEADQALIEQSLADFNINFSLEDICGLQNGEFPDFPDDPREIEPPLLDLGVSGQSSGTPSSLDPSAALSCIEGELNGIEGVVCTLDSLAPGQSQSTSFTRTATELGTFLNLAFGRGGTNGVCDDGTHVGEACGLDEDCGGGSCDPGICSGGDQPGIGCESNSDCPPDGECLNCERCSQPGRCSGGDRKGEECFVDDDCPPDKTCICGIPVVCTETNVVSLPDGGTCTSGSLCESGNCVDGVCCDTTCTEDGFACNLSTNPGVCSPIVSPAPTTSTLALLAGISVLLAAAWLRLRNRNLPKNPAGN